MDELNPESSKIVTPEDSNILQEIEKLSNNLRTHFSFLFSSKTAKPLEKQENSTTIERAIVPIKAFSNEETNFKTRYEFIQTLGEGGMGVVQLVKDNYLGREVALKKIRIEKELSLDKKNYYMKLWRLSREAYITSVLEHPNIIPLYDINQENETELHFTMRKVEGETLRDICKRYS